MAEHEKRLNEIDELPFSCDDRALFEDVYVTSRRVLESVKRSAEVLQLATPFFVGK